MIFHILTKTGWHKRKAMVFLSAPLILFFFSPLIHCNDGLVKSSQNKPLHFPPSSQAPLESGTAFHPALISRSWSKANEQIQARA